MITTKHLNDFILALNENRFYDAHEVFEELWFPLRFTDLDEVKILKGFINAAVSFELIKRGRITQSKRPWQNYLKYKEILVNNEQLHLYNEASIHIEKIHHSINHQAQ